MTSMDKGLVSTEKAEDPDEIHAAIGEIASLLLKAGKPLELAGLSTMLTQQAEQTADASLQKNYRDAARFVAEKIGS
ncbi:MAG TPA: hypothetical protein DCM44_13525 [Pantoea sp.]|uniref:hypothetical protein n=1 Tax=Pantoea TaxID=53335 RepID=UPI00053554F0|nr:MULTISPECIES: hypothetical protein [Pantoea]POW50835.1 hypothetical protein C3408_25235 [Pantoea alvi]MCG7368661.1 hypothetical protein [Pantoea sp. ACRSH]MCG7391064.1 hypothetical protein [Pantoea sp. ACRSB]MCG7399040.1 hypothetical protein [Pantoea sp. ACRSC]MDU1575880.1 hypothetical protein [Pantoea sp.]